MIFVVISVQLSVINHQLSAKQKDFIFNQKLLPFAFCLV
ncbi:hypothetical protein CY0110_10122 [Crocosphaera chwakensis CCY0110]|uniref:Uncharacterized protein n=1 Tax=Crocosphaera chwakensis CCY0110 TaxID=391612 RepID=A3IGY1_9CHRO|nr:hypothetical protein CY0110_10122 [Crocosphaera chwakensis CCY0110]